MNGATNSNRRSCERVELLEYPNSSLCVEYLPTDCPYLMRRGEGAAVTRIVLLHKHSD